MSADDHVAGRGEQIPKRETEDLREDIHCLIKAYPNMTVAELIGTLELVKQDTIERLRNSP